MTHLLAQVRFRRVNNLPEDAIVNTFHFDSNGMADAAAAQNIGTRLAGFFNTAYAGGSALRAYLSSLLAPTGHQVRVYDQSDPEPRAPIGIVSWDFIGNLGSTSVQPAEVALCMSFKAAALSGANPAHRRGRVYLGPLASGGGIDGGDYRPTTAFMNAVVEAGKALRDNGATEPIWSVYSPTSLALAPVTTVWVDNAFDTQRRRGAASTLRVQHPA